MAQRIKGQETEVIMIVNGVAQSTITDVRSFELTFQLAISSEGYLGETTNRKDSIFNGCQGSIELHFENDDVLDLFKSIVDKARRRTPGTRINIKTTLNFPNGDRRRIILSEAEFGDLRMAFGSRSDFGTISMPFECSDGTFI